MEEYINKVLLGDCCTRLKNLPDNSVDAVVTDPPYELGFMNKGWDSSGVAYNVEMWKECLRVLKPGGYLLSFGGTRTYHRMACAVEDAGFEVRDQMQWIYGTGFPKNLNLGNGLGTALKPANEPIVVARKPIQENTIVENVEKYGTGGINIDDSRIENENKDPTKVRTEVVPNYKNNVYGKGMGGAEYDSSKDRWPSNVILDPESVALLDKQSSRASRFFYCVKADGEEKELGLESRKKRIVNDGRKTSIDNPYQRGDSERLNTHPTVKPIELMKYLVKLVTPKGGIVLDPFCGSGTTLIAAKVLGFKYIGIEMIQEYVDISNERLQAHNNIFLFK